ncbi:MAG: hypothetical protein R3C49_05510 [Planctomycetaceae bacterium]
MSFSESQIEAITQGVLRELSSHGIAVADDSGCTASVSVQAAAVQRADVELNDRVITEDLLAAHVAAQKIVVRPDAVITPSGHDFIRRSRVPVIRGTGSSPKNSVGTVFVIGDCSSVTAASASAGWGTVKAGCEFDAAEKCSSLIGQRPVVCCGGEPSVTACLLNRNPANRAAVVCPATDLPRLIRKMNPQAVCLNPSGWSFVDVVRLLRALGDLKAAAPEQWKELPR